MSRLVMDTNCLVQCISPRSRYRPVWNRYLEGADLLCVTNDILDEYEEILERLAGVETAKYIIELIVNSPHTRFFTPHYHFHLITSDPDDDKFVDCAVAANARYIVTEDSHFQVLRRCDFPRVECIGLDGYLELAAAERRHDNPPA